MPNFWMDNVGSVIVANRRKTFENHSKKNSLFFQRISQEKNAQKYLNVTNWFFHAIFAEIFVNECVFIALLQYFWGKH